MVMERELNRMDRRIGRYSEAEDGFGHLKFTLESIVDDLKQFTSEVCRYEKDVTVKKFVLHIRQLVTEAEDLCRKAERYCESERKAFEKQLERVLYVLEKRGV